MYQIFYYSLLIPLLLYCFYFLFSCVFAFFRKKTIGQHRPKNRLAIIIPARNEQDVIGNLIDSLKEADYPNHLYDIYVFVNHCKDHTEQLAKKHGARVVSVTTPVHSKGDVLEFAFATLQKKNKYDGYLVFDADNVVDEKFLRRMNDAIVEGYEVAQGFRDCKNPDDTWVASCYALYYWGQNVFFNQGRMNVGASSSINGTGFMIHRNYLDQYGFTVQTMTEDIEFTAQCALYDKKIAFVCDAITYDEQPLYFDDSFVQRKRWTTGTIQCCVQYVKDLLNHAYRKKDLSSLDMALFFLSPFVQVFALLLFVTIWSYQFYGIPLNDIFSYMVSFPWYFFVITYSGMLLLGVVVVTILHKRLAPSIKGILMFPIFMLTWLPINFLCMFLKNIQWSEIRHTRNVRIDEVGKKTTKQKSLQYTKNP